MLSFDEGGLARDLDQLPKPLRVAFAAAVAERLVPAFTSFSRGRATDPSLTVLTSLLDRTWAEALTHATTSEELRAMAEECVALVPDEDESWSPEQAVAEDAVAAAAYAVRTLASGDSKEAAWAARRGFEAAEYVAEHDDSDEAATTVEHPVVQAELRRQQRDIRLALEAARTGSLAEGIEKLRNQSKAEAQGSLGRRDNK